MERTLVSARATSQGAPPPRSTSARAPRLRLVLRIGGDAFEEMVAIDDAEELCRRLIASPWGWGSSTLHPEAVELLAQVQGASELPASFVALMVCTCRRWDRVTAKLIAAVQDSALLDDAELDELADSFLSHEQVISYPLTWASPQWLAVNIDGGAGQIHTVSEDTLGHHRVSVEPPLRRWAACRRLRSDPAGLGGLLRAAKLFEPRHRDALVHGLLDAADVLDEAGQRTLVTHGLDSGQGSVRRAALDRVYKLDGADRALCRARSDPNAAVRRWKPPVPQLDDSMLLWAWPADAS